YVFEHEDVSHVRLRFLERRGSQYRIRASALGYNVLHDPSELVFETWITQQPPGRYGGWRRRDADGIAYVTELIFTVARPIAASRSPSSPKMRTLPSLQSSILDRIIDSRIETRSLIS